jgi:hypothetical protein
MRYRPLRRIGIFLWGGLLFQLGACGGDPGAKDAPQDTQDSQSDTSVGTVTITGCVTGQLRDFNNAAFPNAAIRAVELAQCKELDAESSFGDGTFCLENLPVQEPVELQTAFLERCTWEHSKQFQVLAKGHCAQPETCFNLETWFECEGDPLSCQ